MKRIIVFLLLFSFYCSAQILKLNNNQVVVHDAHIELDSATWNVPIAKCYAYIDSAIATETTLAETYYFLQGRFVNQHTTNFIFTGDTLTYSNGDHHYLDGSYAFSMKSSASSTIITVALYLNDALVEGTQSSTKITNAGDERGVSRPFMIFAHTGDKIKIMVKSDKAGASITAVSGSATIHKI